jgi:GT2 family glycosyltransferase
MEERVRVRCVVVAYGRADRLGAALDSIARACKDVPAETVVVLAEGDPDDAARAHGARVIRASEGEPHTPGANRNRGAFGASAPYLCFADGDVVLADDFVARAIARLEAASALGGVGGRIHERQWEGTRLVREIPDSYKSGAGGPVEMLATAWLARRSAFEAVGGFDARLPAEEDVDLSVRLAAAGYPVEAMDARAAYHDCPPRPTWSEFARRWRTGLYAGQGILLRVAWGTPHFARHLWRQRLFLAATAFAALGPVLAALALTGGGAGGAARSALALWALAGALAVLAMAAKKKSLSLGAMSVAAWVVLGASIVHAFARGPKADGAGTGTR